jgi:hypothetical protein
MAQNIDQTKCKFYLELIPPLSGTVSYELSIGWGSRLVVHSGRARGLYAIGTVQTGGTTITFPSGYFSDIPIVDVMRSNSSTVGTFTLDCATSLEQKSPYEYIAVGTDNFFLYVTSYCTIAWRAYGV